MSILIKGMEMPKDGYIDVRLFSDGTATTQTGQNPFYKEFQVVEVSPHGRLIDADALDTSILQAGFSHAITRRKLRYTPGEVRQKIANAPTIIPAEEGE